MEKHGGEASLQKSLKKNQKHHQIQIQHLRAQLPAWLSWQLDPNPAPRVGIVHTCKGLKGKGVGHQPLGCKRVEVEESQEIRNSAGGRTFQHSAMLEKYHVPIMYPPQVQYSALASKTCKTPACE